MYISSYWINVNIVVSIILKSVNSPSSHSNSDLNSIGSGQFNSNSHSRITRDPLVQIFTMVIERHQNCWHNRGHWRLPRSVHQTPCHQRVDVGVKVADMTLTLWKASPPFYRLACVLHRCHQLREGEGTKSGVAGVINLEAISTSMFGVLN